MNVTFDPIAGAYLTRDDFERVRAISHLDPYRRAEAKSPPEVAMAYVRAFAELFRTPTDWLQHLDQPVSYLVPRDQAVEHQISEEKTLFDSTTVGFVQTVLNVPVWGAGLTVTMKHGPYRVVGAINTSQELPQAKLPGTEILERYRRLFEEVTEAASQKGGIPSQPRERANGVGKESPSAAFVRGLTVSGNGRQRDEFRLIRGRFFAYRYDPAARLPRQVEPLPEALKLGSVRQPTLTLAPVPPSIRPNDYYLVAEVTFGHRPAGLRELVWRALVELETGAVLRLRAMAAGVHGMVFPMDPITAKGDRGGTLNPALSSAVLNPFRKSVLLPNLDVPVAGTQALSGSLAKVTHEAGPAIVPPKKKAGANFNFAVRTNDFAAVNAYYHVDRFFRDVEDLGFSVRAYFKNTAFPVPVDHRDSADSNDPLGNNIDAFCVGDGRGGIHHVGLALNDLTDTVHPLGRACDSRVYWHELGGHGALFEHVDDTYLGFAHSAGDALAAIRHAPGSKAPDPYVLVPWNPVNDRRLDRDVTAGWAWGGVNDTGMSDGQGYLSEQILATTLFRIYESIGGKSDQLARKKFASRMMLYLILRTIASFTPATNPDSALAFANALMAVDLLDWTTEGICGGAYGKVIRWAFEKQGLYQPRGAPSPVVTAGEPPEVDVYIDDGRAGEYTFRADHTKTTTIWNRRVADGLTAHQRPVLGQTNHAYVKVKNRGTQTARNVRVKGFHCKPGAGLVWPRDLQPMTTPEFELANSPPRNGKEEIAGPFAWTPITNAVGEDTMFMIVSADGDPSNVEHLAAGETIDDWRLVPNDNNIGQRNVVPKP